MSEQHKRPSIQGAFFGLSAAFLFGASMPLAKELLGEIQPFLLAGLFYLGSGLGLGLWLVATKLLRKGEAKEAPIRKQDWPWLLTAVLFGGILAELLLMWGLTQTPASEASLLLNLEGAFSALIAWLLFREHANKRVVTGMFLITGGAMALSVGNNWQLHFSLAGLCIVAACLGWAIDNNLTRRISHVDPVAIASIKGSVAGLVNVGIGLGAGAHIPSVGAMSIAMVVGLLSYGVSLVLFIFGMRHIGTARVSAYFSAAPFIGAGTSILFLHEPITAAFSTAALLMGVGIWLHLTEQHGHEHTHTVLEHEHSHVHDEHHQHEHSPGCATDEPHTHAHRHEELTHSHPHHPDIHHHHEH